ncbi:hypothetical protein [Maribacter aurantiacus]|uniref:DUF4393 domain-containing protein n=1 Tax=Maribacter aurantiacus TaxID=1882343 RepID=A0A5R8M5A4_9FLAO|nr:hypothetical protein [Maribacter aurantiacus]TLF44741.1 hypothetical protein FEK29_10930 [Maribacter aurantiacus]
MKKEIATKSSISKKIEKGLEQSQLADNVKNIFTTLLSATVVGGPFANLINSYIPSRRFLRLENFVNDLAVKIQEVKDDINVNYIETEEFSFLFEQSIKSVSENYQKEKLEAYKAILINSLLPNEYNEEQKEFYLNLVGSLTVIHLKILNFAQDTFAYLRKNEIEPKSITGSLENSLKQIFSDYDFNTIIMAINDLYQYGLVNIDTSNIRTMTVNRGMDIVGDKRTTESGDKFVDFITT